MVQQAAVGTSEGGKEREIPDTWWLFLHKSVQLVSRAHSHPASCASSTAPLAYTEEVTGTDMILACLKSLRVPLLWSSQIHLLCYGCDAFYLINYLCLLVSVFLVVSGSVSKAFFYSDKRKFHKERNNS